MHDEIMNDYAFEQRFQKRTKLYGLRVVRLFQTLQNNPDAQVIREQLLRTSTPVAYEYCAACRTRSSAEFNTRIDIAVEEADKSLFWLEALEKSGVVSANLLVHLKQEADEITAILTTIRKSSLSKK